MSNGLTVPQSQLPSTITADDAVFNDLAKGSSFLGRLQLYTKGKAINRGLVSPGEYGIPENDENITRLTNSVDVIPLARRPKAIDMSDKDAVVQSFDPNSDAFKAIADKSNTPDSGCMYGVSFLLWIPVIARFVEFFCGTKTSRSEAGKLYPFLPSAEQPARVATLGSRVIETDRFSWHAPTIKESSTPPQNLPNEKQLVDEISKFLNPKVEQVEKVEEAEAAGRRRAR